VRLVFLGTPVDAVAPLRALVEAGHDVALVLTQPDRRRSRGGGAEPSPVKQATTELGLPVLTPARAREAIADVAATGAQLGVVVGFGQLLPLAFLDAPNGFVNLHYSLLPRWRARRPSSRHPRRRPETGVCLMRIEGGPGYRRDLRAGVDADRARRRRGATRLTALGTRLLLEHLPRRRHRSAGERTDVRREAHGGRVPDRRAPTGLEVARCPPEPATGRMDDRQTGQRAKVWRA
jgi:methionyl-tRNA formyltransferase